MVLIEENCASVMYVAGTVLCGCALFILLYVWMQSFERLKANSVVNPQLLREPKPSIRGGHISHMHTNKLADFHSRGTHATIEQNRDQGYRKSRKTAIQDGD